MTARILALLGAYLGPEDQLVAPASDNPRGFWEFRPIVELNTELLERLGGRAFAPPIFRHGWETAPELEDLRTRARALIAGTFGHPRFWAWKDPRTCLTLAFWQLIVAPTHYLICVRNPSEVASSIERRNGVLLERSLYLWLLYTRAAISGTSAGCRTLVIYDEIINNPMKRTAELVRFLGAPETAEEQQTLAQVATFVDSRLRHHRDADPERSPAVSSSVRRSSSLDLALRAYAALVDRGLSDPPELDSFFEEALDAVPQWAIPAPSGIEPAGGSRLT